MINLVPRPTLRQGARVWPASRQIPCRGPSVRQRFL